MLKEKKIKARPRCDSKIELLKKNKAQSLNKRERAFIVVFRSERKGRLYQYDRACPIIYSHQSL